MTKIPYRFRILTSEHYNSKQHHSRSQMAFSIVNLQMPSPVQSDDGEYVLVESTAATLDEMNTVKYVRELVHSISRDGPDITYT